MIGTDTEVLLVDSTNTLVSSIGLIGGSKDKPFLVDKGNLQEDNVLAEFAINPASSKKEFWENIEEVYGILQVKMKNYDLETCIRSSAHYPQKELEHPMAKEFGCDPDFNAYTMEENTAPDPETVGTLRSCGGHIHVSFDGITDDESRASFIRILDLFLGVPSVLMDSDTERRELYGKAGSYRAKDYGVEYRTLSNFWIQSSAHIDWAYEQVERAEAAFKEGFRIFREVGDRVMQCINEGDTELARMLIKEHQLEIV